MNILYICTKIFETKNLDFLCNAVPFIIIIYNVGSIIMNIFVIFFFKDIFWNFIDESIFCRLF